MVMYCVCVVYIHTHTYIHMGMGKSRFTFVHMENNTTISPGWVGQLVGVCPVHLGVSGSTPGQGVCRRQPIDVSVMLMFFLPLLSLSLPFPLSLKSMDISSGED